MEKLTARELLLIWESGMNQSLIQKTLGLLYYTYRDADIDRISKLSISERDMKIMEIRKLLFGSRLLNTAYCPECSEQIEWETNINEFLHAHNKEHENTNEFNFEIDDFNISFRLPNSIDVRDVISNMNGIIDPMQLLKKCILSINHNEEIFDTEKLPEHIIEALNQRMEEVDPYADIQMVLHCSSCSAEWEIQFDIMSYVWIEINNWARSILQDIYILAKVFGWSENDILNMNPIRRQLYLEMVNT